MMLLTAPRCHQLLDTRYAASTAPWGLMPVTAMHTICHSDTQGFTDLTTSSVARATFPGLPTPKHQLGTDFTTTEAVLASPAISSPRGSQFAQDPEGDTGLRSGAGSSSYQPKYRRQVSSLLLQKAVVNAGDICQGLAGYSFVAHVTCFPPSPEHLSAEHLRSAGHVPPPP